MTDVTAKLAEAISAMLTHMGMDEDEWNKPTFDQARAALAAYEAAQAEPVAWMYQAKRSDGSTHGPYLCWKPTHIDVMSADMGVQPTPLFAAPAAQADPLVAFEDRNGAMRKRPEDCQRFGAGGIPAAVWVCGVRYEPPKENKHD